MSPMAHTMGTQRRACLPHSDAEIARVPQLRRNRPSNRAANHSDFPRFLSVSLIVCPIFLSSTTIVAHMWYRWAADAVLVLHFAFVLFVVLGALLVLRWPRLARVHVPVALYGALIEFAGFICPLTP